MNKLILTGIELNLVPCGGHRGTPFQPPFKRPLKGEHKYILRVKCVNIFRYTLF